MLLYTLCGMVERACSRNKISFEIAFILVDSIMSWGELYVESQWHIWSCWFSRARVYGCSPKLERRAFGRIWHLSALGRELFLT